MTTQTPKKKNTTAFTKGTYYSRYYRSSLIRAPQHSRDSSVRELSYNRQVQRLFPFMKSAHRRAERETREKKARDKYNLLPPSWPRTQIRLNLLNNRRINSENEEKIINNSN